MKSSQVGMKIIFMVLPVIAFFTPINVFAQGPLYLAIKPGIYSPRSSSLDRSEIGFSGEVDFGYRVNPNIAAEIGVGYLYTEGKETIAGETFRDREFDINVLPITFTLRAILPYKKWEFFGLGGAGVYIVGVPRDIEDHDRRDSRHHDHDDDDDYHYDARLGGYLGAGINYHISRRIFVGAEGKYLWTDKVKIGFEESGVHREKEFRMDGFIATAVIGIKF